MNVTPAGDTRWCGARSSPIPPGTLLIHFIWSPLHEESHRASPFPLALALLPTLVAGALLSGCSKVPDTDQDRGGTTFDRPLGALGQDLLNGVNLAVKELNRDGFMVDGKRVQLEVVSVDDKADAATGKQVAQQLVDAGVVAVIGHLNSGVSIEAAPIYAAKDIAQIAISTNPKFTQLGLNSTFRMVANDTLQARAIGSFAATQLSASRYAALDDGTPYGKGLTDGAAAQLKAENKEVVVRKSFDDKTVEFDALAGELKAARVEVIVSTLNDFQALALLKALQGGPHASQAAGWRHGEDHRHGQGRGLDRGVVRHIPRAGGQGVHDRQALPGEVHRRLPKAPGLWRPRQLRQHLCVDGRHAKGQVG